MSRQLIGVDVGGTKTAVASLRDGVLDEPQVFATEKVSSKALIATPTPRDRECDR